MSRLITILLILLVFVPFLISTQVLAQTSIDPSIAVSYSPNPYSTDKGNVKFTIQSNNKFILNSNYSYTIRPKGTRQDYCKNPGGSIDLMPGPLSAKFWGTVKPKSTSIIEFEWSPDTSINAVCSTFYGVWTFGMWLGDDPSQINAASVIVGGYDFLVEQPGGGIPEIRPFDDPIAVGTAPMAVLINARKDNHYSFWWEGTNIRSIVKDFTAPGNGNFVIDLDSNNSNTQTAMSRTGTPKICAEIGSHATAIGLTCRYSTTFNYVGTPPIYSQSCNLIPNPPRENDTLSLQATGLDSSKTYQGELAYKRRQTDPDTGLPTGDEKEYTQALETTLPDSSGSLLVNLKTVLPKNFEGTINLKEAGTDTLICSKPINIADRNAPRIDSGSIPKPCASGDPTCTASAAISCGDKTNPGISTAIGCIHTSPVEFTKDLMKFIIGIGGGLAFLMMLLGAFQMLTSAGNPDSLNAGRQRFTDAIIGLLFVIFAVLLLQIIGANVLGLPDFKP